MKGNAIIIGDEKAIFKAAINAALQGEGIYIVDAPRAVEPSKYLPTYLPLYPEIKQHEQYGWYRKFDTKKKY